MDQSWPRVGRQPWGLTSPPHSSSPVCQVAGLVQVQVAGLAVPYLQVFFGLSQSQSFWAAWAYVLILGSSTIIGIAFVA